MAGAASVAVSQHSLVCGEAKQKCRICSVSERAQRVTGVQSWRWLDVHEKSFYEVGYSGPRHAGVWPHQDAA